MNRRCMGKRKFVAHFHVDLQGQAANSSDTEKWRIGKTDQVKTLKERQVKASPNFWLLIFAVVLWPVGGMSGAEEPVPSEAKGSRIGADLIFVDGNIYTLNE